MSDIARWKLAFKAGGIEVIVGILEAVTVSPRKVYNGEGEYISPPEMLRVFLAPQTGTLTFLTDPKILWFERNYWVVQGEAHNFPGIADGTHIRFDGVQHFHFANGRNAAASDEVMSALPVYLGPAAPENDPSHSRGSNIEGARP